MEHSHEPKLAACNEVKGQHQVNIPSKHDARRQHLFQGCCMPNAKIRHEKCSFLSEVGLCPVPAVVSHVCKGKSDSLAAGHSRKRLGITRGFDSSDKLEKDKWKINENERKVWRYNGESKEAFRHSLSIASVKNIELKYDANVKLSILPFPENESVGYDSEIKMPESGSDDVCQHLVLTTHAPEIEEQSFSAQDMLANDSDSTDLPKMTGKILLDISNEELEIKHADTSVPAEDQISIRSSLQILSSHESPVKEVQRFSDSDSFTSSCSMPLLSPVKFDIEEDHAENSIQEELPMPHLYAEQQEIQNQNTSVQDVMKFIVDSISRAENEEQKHIPWSRTYEYRDHDEMTMECNEEHTEPLGPYMGNMFTPIDFQCRGDASPPTLSSQHSSLQGNSDNTDAKHYPKSMLMIGDQLHSSTEFGQDVEQYSDNITTDSLNLLRVESSYSLSETCELYPPCTKKDEEMSFASVSLISEAKSEENLSQWIQAESETEESHEGADWQTYVSDSMAVIQNIIEDICGNLEKGQRKLEKLSVIDVGKLQNQAHAIENVPCESETEACDDKDLKSGHRCISIEDMSALSLQTKIPRDVDDFSEPVCQTPEQDMKELDESLFTPYSYEENIINDHNYASLSDVKSLVPDNYWKNDMKTKNQESFRSQTSTCEFNSYESCKDTECAQQKYNETCRNNEVIKNVESGIIELVDHLKDLVCKNVFESCGVVHNSKTNSCTAVNQVAGNKQSLGIPMKSLLKRSKHNNSLSPKKLKFGKSYQNDVKSNDMNDTDSEHELVIDEVVDWGDVPAVYRDHPYCRPPEEEIHNEYILKRNKIISTIRQDHCYCVKFYLFKSRPGNTDTGPNKHECEVESTQVCEMFPENDLNANFQSTFSQEITNSKNFEPVVRDSLELMPKVVAIFGADDLKKVNSPLLDIHRKQRAESVEDISSAVLNADTKEKCSVQNQDCLFDGTDKSQVASKVSGTMSVSSTGSVNGLCTSMKISEAVISKEPSSVPEAEKQATPALNTGTVAQSIPQLLKQAEKSTPSPQKITKNFFLPLISGKGNKQQYICIPPNVLNSLQLVKNQKVTLYVVGNNGKNAQLVTQQGNPKVGNETVNVLSETGSNSKTGDSGTTFSSCYPKVQKKVIGKYKPFKPKVCIQGSSEVVGKPLKQFSENKWKSDAEGDGTDSNSLNDGDAPSALVETLYSHSLADESRNYTTTFKANVVEYLMSTGTCMEDVSAIFNVPTNLISYWVENRHGATTPNCFIKQPTSITTFTKQLHSFCDVANQHKKQRCWNYPRDLKIKVTRYAQTRGVLNAGRKFGIPNRTIRGWLHQGYYKYDCGLQTNIVKNPTNIIKYLKCRSETITKQHEIDSGSSTEMKLPDTETNLISADRIVTTDLRETRTVESRACKKELYSGACSEIKGEKICKQNLSSSNAKNNYSSKGILTSAGKINTDTCLEMCCTSIGKINYTGTEDKDVLEPHTVLYLDKNFELCPDKARNIVETQVNHSYATRRKTNQVSLKKDSTKTGSHDVTCKVNCLEKVDDTVKGLKSKASCSMVGTTVDKEKPPYEDKDKRKLVVSDCAESSHEIPCTLVVSTPLDAKACSMKIEDNTKVKSKIDAPKVLVEINLNPPLLSEEPQNSASENQTLRDKAKDLGTKSKGEPCRQTSHVKRQQPSSMHSQASKKVKQASDALKKEYTDRSDQEINQFKTVHVIVLGTNDAESEKHKTEKTLEPQGQTTVPLKTETSLLKPKAAKCVKTLNRKSVKLLRTTKHNTRRATCALNKTKVKQCQLFGSEAKQNQNTKSALSKKLKTLHKASTDVQDGAVTNTAQNSSTSATNKLPESFVVEKSSGLKLTLKVLKDEHTTRSRKHRQRSRRSFPWSVRIAAAKCAFYKGTAEAARTFGVHTGTLSDWVLTRLYEFDINDATWLEKRTHSAVQREEVVAYAAKKGVIRAVKKYKLPPGTVRGWIGLQHKMEKRGQKNLIGNQDHSSVEQTKQ